MLLLEYSSQELFSLDLIFTTVLSRLYSALSLLCKSLVARNAVQNELTARYNNVPRFSQDNPLIEQTITKFIH